MQKLNNRIAGALLFATVLSTLAVHAQTIEFEGRQWEPHADECRVENYLGRQSLYLKGGTAVVKDSVFTDGIIEFDIACTSERGFMGVIWRVQDEENYEEFYIRPHQSGNPDANQYTPVFNGNAGWQLYYGAGYGAPVSYQFNQWMSVKIVVASGKAEVYLNDMEKPVLFAPELKREIKTGRVGFSAGNFAPGHFSRFRFTPMNNPTLKGTGKPFPAASEATIMSWQVSDTFDEKTLEKLYRLSGNSKTARQWQTLASESTGLANLARLHGLAENRNTVFARTIINADRAQVKRLSFGFSDRIRVYFNDQLLYGGTDDYVSRDYRFLGTMGWYDSVYLPLKKGRNELWLAVSEDFGGWGIQARFDDLDGITIKR